MRLCLTRDGRNSANGRPSPWPGGAASSSLLFKPGVCSSSERGFLALSHLCISFGIRFCQMIYMCWTCREESEGVALPLARNGLRQKHQIWLAWFDTFLCFPAIHTIYSGLFHGFRLLLGLASRRDEIVFE